MYPTSSSFFKLPRVIIVGLPMRLLYPLVCPRVLFPSRSRWTKISRNPSRNGPRVRNSISPLVDHLPKSSGVPSPKDVLGYYIGAPKKLTYYADMLKYYHALEAKSPRVKVINIGKTDEGRECAIVFVGAEESIKNLETYRGYLAKLADPRQLTDAQARDIIAKAKPIYHLMGGLHSAETGAVGNADGACLSAGDWKTRR